MSDPITPEREASIWKDVAQLNYDAGVRAERERDAATARADLLERRIRDLTAALTIIATGKPGAAPSVDWQCLRCTSVIETAASALATQEEAGADEPNRLGVTLEDERDTLLTALVHLEESTAKWARLAATPEERRIHARHHLVAHAGLRNSPNEPEAPASAPPAPRPGEQEADPS